MIFYKSHQFDFFSHFLSKLFLAKYFSIHLLHFVPSNILFEFDRCVQDLIVVCRILFFKFSVQCVILSIQFFVVLRVINDFFFLSYEQ